jgi:hypothetical protein
MAQAKKICGMQCVAQGKEATAGSPEWKSPCATSTEAVKGAVHVLNLVEKWMRGIQGVNPSKYKSPANKG